MKDPALQALLDQTAIQCIRHDFARALDRKDWQLLTGLLAEEIAVDFTSFDMPAQVMHQQVLIDSFQHNLSRPGLVTQHLCSNFRITLDQHRATSVSHWVGHHFVPGLAGGEEFTLRAEYTDLLIQLNGRWFIIGLTARKLFTTGNPQVLLQ